MPEKRGIDRKIIAMPYDYGDRMEFLADTVVKNLSFGEIQLFNEYFVQKANKKAEGMP